MSAQDKIAHIASLPPQEIARIVNQARDWLTIEHQIAKRYAAAYATQGKRHTAAPTALQETNRWSKPTAEFVGPSEQG
jgi:hypothetical protein